MRKLTREQKIMLYEQRRLGATITELSKTFHLRREGVKYLIRLIDRHGYSVLRDGHSRRYPPQIKEQAVLEVLEMEQTIGETAVKYGLSSKTALTKWIKDYQMNGNRIIERKRGRKRQMTTYAQAKDAADVCQGEAAESS